MQGLNQAIRNLNALNDTLVPRATAQAINRVAGRAISRSTRRVAGEVRVQQKLIRRRVLFRRASPEQNPPRATLTVNRGNLPAIALGAARRTGKQGSVLKIGQHRFPGAFIQRLANGRWHVMRRTSKSRYPIEVVKIPVVTPLTNAYQEESRRLLQSDMGKEMGYALKNQLRLYLVRKT